jgi:hypothetical protein
MTQDTADPLPSWKDGKSRPSIEAFVQRVTTAGGKDFLPQGENVKRTNQSTNNQAENPEFSGYVGGFGRYRHYTRVGVKGDRSL